MSIIPLDYLLNVLGPEKVKALGISADKPFRVVLSVMVDALALAGMKAPCSPACLCKARLSALRSRRIP
ncbi:hypothetical protein ACEN2S_20655 [Phaeovulum sp. W22_SRMD_FR3]